MKKTIGMLAHVDAGKTTLSEEMLYLTQSIRSKGRVDHKDSYLDNNTIEKERGITIFSEQARFFFNDCEYYLLDTPGHIDFSTEMERTLDVLDYAILIISAVEGIQGHTKTLWRLLQNKNVPVFIFINKIDRVGSDKIKVINDIKRELTTNIIVLEDIIKEKGFDKDSIEKISEYSEELLDKYCNDEYDFILWKDELKKQIKDRNIYPIMCGSALQEEGIIEFISNLDDLTYTDYEKNKEFIGQVYKVRYEDNGSRVTYIKAIEGKLKVRQEINVTSEEKEKISSIRLYNGNKYEVVDKIEAGDIFAVTGISKAIAGDIIGSKINKINYELIPTMTSKAIFSKEYNPKEMLKYFKILDNEDPSLSVVWNEEFQDIHIHIMGKIQLEVLKDIINNRFNIDVEFGPCEILYKETINSEVIGYGHFEPLKHYAEVHLKMEPLPRNSGIVFESRCHTDDLDYGEQNLIKTHIFEREHHGLLTGSSITDIKFTLLTGRSHNKHTSGGDFREATFRALRQGLEQAENILLEPFYKFEINIPVEYIGKALSDIQRLRGDFEPPETIDGFVVIRGRGPVETFMDYNMEILAYSRGKGSIVLVYDGYDTCEKSTEVIEKIGYSKEADIEYTSTSIFCSKGQSYLVNWKEAKEKMHCLK